MQIAIRRTQSGAVLLESLIAVLVFSLGILAIVGMQAFAINVSSDAKYRSDAAILANELIGRMWINDRTQATLQAAFSSPAGAAYTAWAWAGASGTGTQSSPAAGTVVETLPGAGINPPTVTVTPVATTTPPSSLVTITVFWQLPSDATAHSHRVVAQIGG